MSINETRRPCSMGLPAIPCYSILFWLWPWSRSQHIQQQLSISGKDGSAPSLAWRGLGALSPRVQRVQRHRGVRSAESEWQARRWHRSRAPAEIFPVNFFVSKFEIIWVKLSIWQCLTVSDSIWVSWVGILLRWGAAFQDEPLRPCADCAIANVDQGIVPLIDVSMLILNHAGKHRHVLGIASVGTDSQTILVWIWFDSQLRRIVVPSG